MNTSRFDKMENGIRIAVVILNWNNESDTIRCLESIQSVRDRLLAVVVDNGSEDPTTLLEASHLYDRLALNDTNKGFAGGCNVGIELAFRDMDCDAVWLLNNDSILPFPRRAVDALAEHFGPTADAGLVGSRIRWYPDTDRIWSTGGRITWHGREVHFGHGEVDGEHFEGQMQRDFISGASMVIPRHTWQVLGSLPDCYFFGKEEWEYSERARREVGPLKYDSRIVVDHEASNSHDWSDLAYVFNGTASRFIFLRRNRPTWQFLLWATVFGVYLWTIAPWRPLFDSSRLLAGASWSHVVEAQRAGYRHGLRREHVSLDDLERFRARMDARRYTSLGGT